MAIVADIDIQQKKMNGFEVYWKVFVVALLALESSTCVVGAFTVHETRGGYWSSCWRLIAGDSNGSNFLPLFVGGGGSLDYEYIPPNPNTDDFTQFQSDLLSAYPAGTPAGLRGEAVRAALRSGQCIGWNLNQGNGNDKNNKSSLAFGVVRVTGAGVLDFLNSKLTQTFARRPPPPPMNDFNTGSSTITVTRGTFQSACLLNAKGRLLDVLRVAVTEDAETAYLWTSPGHAGSELFERLDPYIFPLDQVQLQKMEESAIFSLASIRAEHVQQAWETYIWPYVVSATTKQQQSGQEMAPKLPDKGCCLCIQLDDRNVGNDEDLVGNTLLVIPTSGLPDCAVYGYSFGFLGRKASQIGQQIWQEATLASNEPVIAVGAREYESLRIETSSLAFGYEMVAHLTDKKKKKMTRDEKVAEESLEETLTTGSMTPPTPLELHLEDMIDTEKGCYLGQEGIAAVLKNPRGPPRTLYQVVFEHGDNIYEHQSEGDKSKIPNKTKLPQSGDELFVLGSNEDISAGFLTSVAEPSSTGQAETVGLALIRRADSIKKQMKEKELEIPSKVVDVDGIIAPPPRDPLEGLEVIVGGSYTVGTLRGIPSRRLRKGEILYDIEPNLEPSPADHEEYGVVRKVEASSLSNAEVLADSDDEADEDMNNDAVEAAAKAEAEAEAAAAEAKRKAEKMEMLKQRAEAAMARRKQKKN